MSHKFLVSLIVIFFITACAPAPIPTTSAVAPEEIPSVPPTLTPSGTSTSIVDQMVDVGGYQLRIVCSGEGTPTVVVDAALGEAALESGTWLKSRYEVEKTTRICVYDRAGLGSSEAAPTQYRTSQDFAKDLHALLANGNVRGPYVLVGHNLGGLNVRLYASQYPDEVVGMVLVDAVHPDFHTESLAVLPPESPDEPSNLRGLRLMLTDYILQGSTEGVDFATSADQVRATGSLGNLPLVVLTRRTAWLTSSDLPADVDAKMDTVWANLQADLATLSSNSTHVIAIPDGQSMPVNEDQLIIDAILKVVEQAR